MTRSALLLAALSLASAASALSAQENLPTAGAPQMRRVSSPNGQRPMVHVTYDVAENRIRSVETLGAGGLSGTQRGSPPCFDNSDFYLGDTYVVTDPGQELVNWGRKNCTGAGRLSKATIAYLSEAIDVSHGGPGATLQVALYSGTRGFNQLGTEIFRRTITGLPSETPFDPIAPPTVFLTLDFGANPLPLVDGNFGWGFLQLDGDSGPMLVNAPNAQWGTANAMDIYSPGPARSDTYVGTFNYGAICNCASTWMQLEEIGNDELAATTPINGSGVNPLLLEEIFPPRIGQVWAVRTNVSDGCVTLCAGNPDYTILFTSGAALATPVSTRFGEILIDRSQARTAPIFGEGAYFFTIPPDLTLVGTRIYIQAAVLPPVLPSITLTNGLRLRLGY